MTAPKAPASAVLREEPALTTDALRVPFVEAEKPPLVHRIGIEVEKFALDLATATPLDYPAILALFANLLPFSYHEVRENKDGPTIALERQGTSVTLEPGGQVELSGSPHSELHALNEELRRHHRELQTAASALGIAFCAVGFHPLAKTDALPWVPKARYRIMREYLLPLGSGTLDMMQRTATVQVNLDFCSERDALRKLVLGLRLSPLVHAITANSPLAEGQLRATNSLRGDVWLRMDPSRSGLIERLWQTNLPSYDDYIDWALDAGMFLIKRNNETVANTGQTFRDFLRHGYQGHHATMSDWRLHLNTLFPEVRLKNTLELRSADAQPAATLMSLPALWLGLFADEQSLAESETLAQSFSFADMAESRRNLIERGYDATLAGRPVAEYAERLLDTAKAGLERRHRLDPQGRDEVQFLTPLLELCERHQTPADRLRNRLKAMESFDAQVLIAETRLF